MAICRFQRSRNQIPSFGKSFCIIHLLQSEFDYHKKNCNLIIIAFKCNLKELTAKSALSASGQRSLACACPVAGYIDHMIHWHVQFSFVLGSL